MQSLNDRIAKLRQTRVSLRAAVKAAWREADPGYRQQKLQAASAALASTEEAWTALQAELEARSTRVEVAQLRHTRPSAAPVRRSVPGYVTKVMVPGR